MAAQVNEEENRTKKMTVFVTLPRPRDACPDYRAPVALKVVALEVSRDDTVATVKARLHRMERIPPLQQRLVFACSALPDDDGATLAEHGVTDSSTIQLVETKMQLFVRANGGTITVSDVESSDTVESFRLRMQRRVGVELRPAKQRLIWNGKQMEDGHTLADYGVRGSTMMDLLLRWPVRMRTRVVELDIEATATVGKIKELVEKAEGVPVACQSVSYRAKELDDHDTLADYECVHIACGRHEMGAATNKTPTPPKKKIKTLVEIPAVQMRRLRAILSGPELAAIYPSSCDMDPAS
ncbi:polyubiquitin 11-like [Lolium perenne]|uniref:polyubiquitin 11-like n=1 Tax=Lolium perenne TaxID=4522 RepID=UPI0021F52E0E|nr:polyubiquitin 11-like [Lolium perenne]